LLQAVEPECFFSFSANAWQSNRFRGLFSLFATDFLYLAFCPAPNNKLFIKLGFRRCDDAWEVHPRIGTPNEIVGYVTKKKSFWSPDKHGAGIFTFLTRASGQYDNKGKAAECDFKTFMLNCGLKIDVCDDAGLFCETIR
jgi:hypothetical protein